MICASAAKQKNTLSQQRWAVGRQVWAEAGAKPSKKRQPVWPPNGVSTLQVALPPQGTG